MNRFVAMTDPHIKGVRIKTRTDNYPEVILGKLDFVIGYCEKHKVTKLINMGDMFDNPNVSDYIAGRVAGKFSKAYKKFGLKMYYIAGNHDITGKNFSTYVHGKLAGFEHYEWFNFIGDKPIEFSDAYLGGYHYDHAKESETYFDMPNHPYKKGKLKILALHAMVTGDDRDLIVNGKAQLISYKSLVSDADLILTGHFHPGFGIKKINVLEHIITVANPGSLARTNSYIAKHTVGPAILYIEVDKRKLSKIELIKVPHEINVFKDSKTYNRYEVDSNHFKFVKNLRTMQSGGFVQSNLELLIRTVAGEIKDAPFKITVDLVDEVCMKIKKVREENEK